MPQARSSGSRSTSRSKSSSASSGTSSGRSQAKRSSSGSASPRSRSTRATASKPRSSSSSSSSRSRSSASNADAVAQRLRKLNERIIEAGKEAGETTLSSYEKALKSIAGAIERGPGSSEIEWISNLATVQAKFIRDLTSSLTAAARKPLK